MTPPDRHGSPSKNNNNDGRKKIFVCASKSTPVPTKMSSVKLYSGCQPKPEGPRIFCHQSVIFVKKEKKAPTNRRKKTSPSAFRFSYPSPRVSLISTPTCPPLSASQRLPCAPRRREARKKERVGKPQFKHFTVALRKHCALFVSAREQKARVRACE